MRVMAPVKYVIPQNEKGNIDKFLTIWNIGREMSYMLYNIKYCLVLNCPAGNMYLSVYSQIVLNRPSFTATKEYHRYLSFPDSRFNLILHNQQKVLS